jgi:hypothetical protein
LGRTEDSKGCDLMAFFHAKLRGRLFAIQVRETCGDDWIPAAEPEARAAMALVLGDYDGTDSRATGAEGLDEERRGASDSLGERPATE